MALQLFKHNMDAYVRVEQLLLKYKKAAVIHPTGTGKSFIAFRLIEAHPNAAFVWVSPSEYIFRTQKEALEDTDSAIDFDRVTFVTYAKLLHSPEEDIVRIHADYIILDEFHRAGAAQWENAIRLLLSANPDAGILGLSATNIRYLDNNRDMAEELFDGFVASKMSLGEAIVRGILPAPQYVTTIYRYRKELDKWQRRVSGVRLSNQRSEAQRYLDALKRALEQADGLEKIFERYLTNKYGKYIVFCSNAEHMYEMISLSEKWFRPINKEIHCYSAYSDDPGTSEAFQNFKSDHSDALKLLFCIDMLNEGIHVKDISGVILFRPTVSPIVYKQQIGRALTSGSEKTPLILDVVNNFENLCGISVIEQEMKTAVHRLYKNGEGEKIVTERFEIIEQVKDCRALFNGLETALASSWEQYFQAASSYYSENGHLRVPAKYVTKDGLTLGSWVNAQRRIRAGKLEGTLTPARIERLNNIGMVWENRLEEAWERGIRYAQEYYRANGNLDVPYRFKTEDGYALGTWLAAQKKKQNELSEEQLRCLKNLGMHLEPHTDKQWNLCFEKAKRYYEEHGNLDVPYKYQTEDGFKLASWLDKMRWAKEGKFGLTALTPEKVEQLHSIGFTGAVRTDTEWMRKYEEAKKYYSDHGDLLIPSNYVSESGTRLGKWIVRQRQARKNPSGVNIKLTEERIRLLDEIGMVWTAPSKARRDLFVGCQERNNTSRSGSESL